MNMIEKVARALCRQKYEDIPDIVERIVENCWKSYIPEAKAAIEAVKEPTEEMKTASFGYYEHDCYKQMIEAALKD